MSISLYVGGNVRSDLGEVEFCQCFKEEKCGSLVRGGDFQLSTLQRASDFVQSILSCFLTASSENVTRKEKVHV